VQDLSDGQRHFCQIRAPGFRDLGILSGWAAQVGYDPPGPRLNREVKLEQEYPEMVGEVGIVSFDAETKRNSRGVLYPILISAIFACSSCAFKDYMEPKKWANDTACCGKRKRTYIGKAEIRQFILDLFYQKKHKTVVAWAMFGSQFDFVFILHFLLYNGFPLGFSPHPSPHFTHNLGLNLK
jgi:hypothetical protein